MDDLNTLPANLDHLIITVPELEAGVAELERLTGVRALAGGSHPGRGTANYLVGLAPAGQSAGARIYLEILGPDPQQKAPADGVLPLDAHLAEGLTLQTWAIHSPAFLAKVAGANTEGIDFGEVRDMSRETADGTLLEWRLTSKSPLPDKGTQPFLIDWGESTHPAEATLPSLELVEFQVESPDVESTRAALAVLGAADATVVEGSDYRLHARFRGPGGVLEF